MVGCVGRVEGDHPYLDIGSVRGGGPYPKL